MHTSKLKTLGPSSIVMNQCPDSWVLVVISRLKLTQGLELADVYWLKVVITLRLLTQNSWIDSWWTLRPKIALFQVNKSTFGDARAQQLSKIFCDAEPREVMSRRAQKYVKLLWHAKSNSKQKAQIITILRVKIDVCAYTLELELAWVSLSWAAPTDSCVWVGL